MFPYDRRRSQTSLRSAICDLRSAIIWKPALSSAIFCDCDRRIAEVCFHMIADDRRRSQTLLRSAIRDHMETSQERCMLNRLQFGSVKWVRRTTLRIMFLCIHMLRNSAMIIEFNLATECQFLPRKYFELSKRHIFRLSSEVIGLLLK